MTRHSFGLLLLLLGMAFFWINAGIHFQMMVIVARLAPPETNRPAKNLSDAMNLSRVRKEYQRLFPERARRKSLAIRMNLIVGIVSLILGMYFIR